MLRNVKNGTVCNTDYVRFGIGERVLIMLPGLGDGLQTVSGTALPMAWAYRIFSEGFTVYMFSRRADLPAGYTTREMARDLKETMDALQIPKADVLGVSMGGMIAQWLAIDSGEKVNKLILAVTGAEPDPVMTASVREWMEQARQGDHTALMDSNIRKIYSEAYYNKNRWMIPVVGRITKPKSYDRFLIQAEACLNHDAGSELHRICAPTLVIGGEKDQVLDPNASGKIARRIPGAELKMYPQWGHGLYEEAADFNQVVLEFLR